MLVSEFSSTCQLYEGFEIWEIENLTAFFNGNTVLATIFQEYYKISVKDLKGKRSDIPGSDFDIITNLLGLVNDKSFFIFTLHDENHMDLVGMQRMKVMNFGVDIEKIRDDRVYAMIMDKRGNGS